MTDAEQGLSTQGDTQAVLPTAARQQRHWWSNTVGYQIYIRSFADSNGDGVGDLAGITGHLGYLELLGIQTVWITPFYPSPMADAGYDVSNPRDVDPAFGTLADFDVLVDHAHQHGLKLLIDLVPEPHVVGPPLVPGGLVCWPGQPGARPIPVPRRHGTGGRGAAEQLGIHLRRSGLDAGRRTGSGICTCSTRPSRT